MMDPTQFTQPNSWLGLIALVAMFIFRYFDAKRASDYDAKLKSYEHKLEICEKGHEQSSQDRARLSDECTKLRTTIDIVTKERAMIQQRIDKLQDQNIATLIDRIIADNRKQES